MLSVESLDALANKLSQILPVSLKEAREDLKKNFKLILESTFSEMNLVTREEFDRQTLLLKKAREKLEALEKRLMEV